MYDAKATAAARCAVFDARACTSGSSAGCSSRPSCARRSSASGCASSSSRSSTSRSGELTGLEALARWPAEAEREVRPIEFIPVAEDTGLIGPLGAPGPPRGLRARSADGARDGLVGDDVTISVNVSIRQLGEAGLLEDVAAALRESAPSRSGAAAGDHREHADARPGAAAARSLDELATVGVRAQIDDFGTGYSSLTFLRHFAGDTLKIDRSFIASICADEGSAEIVRTIIGLAHNLDLTAIAEGVETDEQLRKLHQLGARYAQGFLFAEPLDASGAETLLSTWDPHKVAVGAA